MKYLTAIFCSMLAMSSVTAAPARSESVYALMTAMHAEQMQATVLQNMGIMMKSSMQQSLDQRGAPQAQRDLAADLQTKIFALMTEEMSWENMKALYAQVYGESLTQEEVEGLTAFYQSPAGEAYIMKMPLIMQKTTTLMQQRMGPMLQKFSEIAKQTAAKNAAPQVRP